MRTVSYITLSLILPCSLVGQANSDILPPQKRAETLELARKLLTTQPSTESADEIAQKDPFNTAPRKVEKAEPVAQVQVVMADRDILTSIAPSITPSGTMQLGDTYILLFGQKKFKVGDALSITFQGSTYDIQISGIERTSFTLRLNKEEIIRPIKP